MPHYKISWSYIAGFFDGEGSISMKTKPSAPKYGGVNASILQAESNKLPIFVLHDFLNKQKIKHSLQLRRSRVINHQETHVIQINQHDAVLAFLKGIFPYLILKKERALNAIKFIENKDWLVPYKEQEYIDAYKLYNIGNSLRDIEKITGISSRALRKHWKDLNLQTRTHKISTKHWRYFRKAS